MAERLRTAPGVAIAVWILAVVAVLFFLRTARDLLIPIALAVLVSYALEPAVAWLASHRLPRLAATALVMLAVLAGLAGGGYALKDDAAQVVEAVPKAAQRARAMVQEQFGAGMMGATSGSVGTSGTSGTTGDSGPGGSAVAPSFLQRVVSGVFTAAGQIVVVFFLVCFLLLSGNHVRERLIEIAGPDAAGRRVMTTIVTDIDTQIQRYLLVLLFTGAIVGTATWLVLTWMGVQHAAMWGVLAGVFNSIPYFGPVIVAGGLFVVGLVQEGGVTQALQMAGAAIAITSLEGWLLTPSLMGKVERMSPLVVFLGLLLWTWVWGAWGTVLAVPMLVLVKAVADHVGRLRPVSRLMAP